MRARKGCCATLEISNERRSHRSKQLSWKTRGPPALIILRYRPQVPVTSRDHLGLVGKGVTFDTGGISIKPADGMEKMRYDMAGGASVLGAMRAIAQLKPSIPVTR